MTAAVFGLVGVIVGALIQGGASWLMESRREQRAARKAARLVVRSLSRVRSILDMAHMAGATWRTIGLETGAALARWPEHSDVLAGTLDDDDWREIASAMDSVERLHQRGALGPDGPLSDEDREFAGHIAEEMWAASLAAALIGVTGGRLGVRPRVRIRMRRLLRRPVDEAAADRIVRYSYEVEGKTPPDDDRSDIAD